MALQDPVPAWQHQRPSSAEGIPSPAHEHAAHGAGASGDHVHGADEAFPRLALRDLIGARLNAEERRERWQTAALSLGLMLLALALPTEQLLGEGPALVDATDSGGWSSSPLVLQPIAQLLSQAPALGAERTWFLISAGCWAASYPVLMGLLRGIGLPRLAASAATLAVMLSPAVQLTATLPGPAAAALLGTALLLRHLWTQAGGGARRTLSLWFAVCLLHTSLVLLLPAVLAKLLLESRERASVAQPRRQIGLGAALGLLALLALLGLASLGRPQGVDMSDFWGSVRDGILGSASLGGPNRLTWWMLLVPALGVGLLGLRELLRRPAGLNESRPPAWLWVFLVVPVLPAGLAGNPGLELAAWALSPTLALGLASWFSRAMEQGRTRLIWILLVAQVVLSVSFRLTAAAADPNREWTLLASGMLDPGDLVITENAQHEYLLRHRFRLATLDLRQPGALADREREDWWENARRQVRTQQRAGRGVWADWALGAPLAGKRGFEFSKELHELFLLAPVRHLDRRELQAQERAPLPRSISEDD